MPDPLPPEISKLIGLSTGLFSIASLEVIAIGLWLIGVNVNIAGAEVWPRNEPLADLNATTVQFPVWVEVNSFTLEIKHPVS